MPAKPLSDEQLIAASDAYQAVKQIKGAAALLKIPEATFAHRLNAYKRKYGEPGEHVNAEKEFVFSPIPDEELDIEDLVAIRIKQFEKKQAYEEASKLIPVKVKIDGPVGIIHFGDPHVDDDGTSLALLRQHSDLTHFEGVWGANVGDTTNNWIGRLARLYANQSTSASQAWQLAEWFIQRTRWLYMIGGNHDAWSGSADPLKWIARQNDALYKPSECRINLKFPTGRNVIINARHDFAGTSQWNPAHGQMKAAQMGFRDHVMISGHKHTSGYGIVKDASSGRVCHAVQVASYKMYDVYAKERGFRDQTISPACMTIIDPTLDESHPDMIKIFWDPVEGVEYLKWKRRKKK